MSFDLFIQQLLNGLTLGSIYSLVALGLTLVYGIMHIPNFAHGGIYMIGGYVAYTLMTAIGVHYWVAMAAAAAVSAAVAMACERLVFHPLRNAPALHHMIAAIGILLFLEAAAQAIWGAEFRRMPTPYAGSLSLGDIGLPTQRALIIASALVLMIALNLFLRKTLLGTAILAMAQEREGAFLMGIDANKISLLTFAIAGALAAVAAVLFAPINLVYPTMGELVIMKAFVIIILGGMGSIGGAIVGGLIVGLAEALAGFYVSSDYKDLIAFGILVLILAVRPEGLFSKGAR